MITARAHFEKLPEPHQTNCLTAMDKALGNEHFESITDALFIAINWNSIPALLSHGMEAMDYWEELHDACQEGVYNGR